MDNQSRRTRKKKKKNRVKKFFIWIIVLIILVAVIDIINITINKTSFIGKSITAVDNKNKLSKIKENREAYPESLIELAEKNSETIDFVYNYVDRKNNEGEKVKTSTKYPLYIQWDKRWGYDQYGDDFIALNGCGPATLAMVVSGLTGNSEINPKTVAEYSIENGYYVSDVGSSWELMKEGAEGLGLYSEEVPLDENIIKETLKAGHPIIATMGPGKFTSSGHFILLTGVTDNGKIIINDSDNIGRSKKTWDIDVFIQEAQNLWSFSLK